MPSRDQGDFAGQINAMFDRVAPRYDVLNSFMSAGMHRDWKRQAVELTELRPGEKALDVCCGTGDLAIRMAELVGPNGKVIGCDFSTQMLMLALAKTEKRQLSQLTFRQADALSLPYGQGEFAAATMGFALRNLADHQSGVSEMARVVRSGGRVVVLEFTRPRRAPFRHFYDLWFDRLVPVIGRLSKDAAAYSYLPASVRGFADPKGVAAMFCAAGLREVRYRVLAGGIVTIHTGRKP